MEPFKHMLSVIDVILTTVALKNMSSSKDSLHIMGPMIEFHHLNQVAADRKNAMSLSLEL